MVRTIHRSEKYAENYRARIKIVAPGLRRRRTETSCVRGSDTQPFVARPVSTWRKIADPRPGTTGAALYSTSAKSRYAGVIRHSASLPPPNGGRAPHRTCRNEL